ncbi:hypothetical protein P8452_51539 [Trifolium repens]|nr:hypothetical protein P8452_51539 [Trifolium repens]
MLSDGPSLDDVFECLRACKYILKWKEKANISKLSNVVDYLAEHEERFQGNEENMEQLQQWKVALKDAANLSGEHFRSCNPTYQYEFIDKIVKYISNKINRVLLHVAKHPIGLESRVQQLESITMEKISFNEFTIFHSQQEVQEYESLEV